MSLDLPGAENMRGSDCPCVFLVFFSYLSPQKGSSLGDQTPSSCAVGLGGYTMLYILLLRDGEPTELKKTTKDERTEKWLRAHWQVGI